MGSLSEVSGYETASSFQWDCLLWWLHPCVLFLHSICTSGRRGEGTDGDASPLTLGRDTTYGRQSNVSAFLKVELTDIYTGFIIIVKPAKFRTGLLPNSLDGEDVYLFWTFCRLFLVEIDSIYWPLRACARRGISMMDWGTYRWENKRPKSLSGKTGMSLMLRAHSAHGNFDFSLSVMYCLEETDSFLVKQIFFNYLKGNPKPEVDHFSKFHSHLPAALFKCKKRIFFSSTFEKRVL